MSEKTRLQTATTALSAASVSISLGRDLYTRFNEKFSHVASISEKSLVYDALLEWLSTKLPGRRTIFHTNRKGVTRLYDGEASAKVFIDGHMLKVQIVKPDKGFVSFDSEVPSQLADRMVFYSRTAAGLDALEKFVNTLVEEETKKSREIYIYTPGNYGWEASVFPYRDVNSIFLPEGVKEDLVADMETFFNNEERYHRIGIPWHRGYLLYGPPGNGKSSIAAALAHKYRLNLYSMPLSSIKDDKTLAEKIARLQARSVLLIEDADIFSKTMTRKQSDSGPTLAGLLNALDGVATPHGLVTIMTTNHPESLDPALVRDGRMDKRVELSAPTTYQIESMFRYVFDEELGTEHKEFKSMAELAGIFKSHLDSPEVVRLAIKGA